MARTKHASLYAAFDTCKDALLAEGATLSISGLKRILRDKFSDVLEENAKLINDAGITVILRQIMKRHGSAGAVSSQQIAMTFNIPEGLPERVAIPVDSDSLITREWLGLHECTLADLALALKYLASQIKNDGKKRRALEKLMQRVQGVLGNDMENPLTVADAVAMIAESAKGGVS